MSLPPLLGDVPVDLGADDARALARRELARPVYQHDQPSLLQRAVSWLGERVTDLLAYADARSPGGVGGLVVLALALVAVVLAVRWRLGRAAPSARAATALFDALARSADDHRHAADVLAAAGRHDEAVRERMRALVRGLEERDLLELRPGRTAGEAAREAARVVPAAADAVRTAARLFDETVYGGRTADASTSARLRAADDEVRAARPAVLT